LLTVHTWRDDRALCPALQNLAEVVSRMGREDEAAQLRRRQEALLPAQTSKP
jgi:hypothetical protein